MHQQKKCPKLFNTKVQYFGVLLLCMWMTISWAHYHNFLCFRWRMGGGLRFPLEAYPQYQLPFKTTIMT